MDNNEPVAWFEFGQNPVIYKGVYGVLPDKNLDVLPYIYQVPLSMINDTTTLVFFNDSVSDTLILAYNRNFYFQSKECGMAVKLENMQVVSSSFISIDFNLNSNSYYSNQYVFYVE